MISGVSAKTLEKPLTKNYASPNQKKQCTYKEYTKLSQLP